MANEQQSEFRAAYDAGVAVNPVHEINGVPDLSAVVVKDGYNIKDISGWANLRERPRRKSGTVTLHTPDSFVEYVKAFGDANTIITADLAETRLDAILDYHEAGAGLPRWGHHKALYVCRETQEWETWNGVDGSEHAMSQEAFARFIEDNLPDIASPLGAELLELVKALQVRNDVRWTGKVNLVDGAKQLFYEEKVEGQGKGDVKIPETFTLGIAPFEGVPPYELTARLRYRIPNGNLLMWVDLHRPHKIIDDAFRTIVASVQEQLAGMRLVHGKVA